MSYGIIWDFDGTIVDTETPQYEVWQALYHRHGCHFEPALWGQLVGTDAGLDLLDVLAERVGPFDRAGIQRDVDRRIQERMEQAPLRPGVLAMLAAADQAGWPQAIASSSPGWWIHSFLERHRLHDFFKAVCSADDVQAVKPDPALYHLATLRLGFNRRECVAIEDSPHGAMAALKAGLTCLVVPNRSTVDLGFPPGIIRYESLKDVTLETVDRLLSRPYGAD